MREQSSRTGQPTHPPSDHPIMSNPRIRCQNDTLGFGSGEDEDLDDARQVTGEGLEGLLKGVAPVEVVGVVAAWFSGDCDWSSWNGAEDWPGGDDDDADGLFVE